MTNSRDRGEGKRAGEEGVQPKQVKDSVLVIQLREVYHLVRQQNRELSALFEQRRQELLKKLRAHGSIQ